jgi:hypothetical protein
MIGTAERNVRVEVDAGDGDGAISTSRHSRGGIDVLSNVDSATWSAL